MVWRRNKLMSGGGPVLDSGFHYCDSMRYFFGDLDTVYAELRAIEDGRSVSFREGPENAVFVTFSFKSGVVGNWSWNLAAPGAEHHHVTFHGSEGSLRDTTESPYAIFHLFERRPDMRESGRLVRTDGQVYSLAEVEDLHLEALSQQEREELFPGGATDGFAIEIWEFLEAVRGTRDGVEVDGWEGLRSLAVGEAIYESALTGDVIAVDDIISGKRSAYQDPINEHWGL
jgi:predicted dehydrogenase